MRARSPIAIASSAELVPASPTPTLPYPKQTYNLNFFSCTAFFLFGAPWCTNRTRLGSTCATHTVELTWGSSPMMKSWDPRGQRANGKKTLPTRFSREGGQRALGNAFFSVKGPKKMDATMRLFVDAIRGNFFRADAGFGDRSGSIGAAHNIRASECVRACEVGPIAQRSEIDRARGKFPRASNEVRDRSERSKIVRRC